MGEDARKRMKNLYYWFKAVDQFAITIPICLELLCSVLKQVEEGIRRVAVLKVLGDGIRSKVYSCLFGIIR